MKFLVCLTFVLLAVATAEEPKKQKRGIIGLGYSGIAVDAVPYYSNHVVSSPIITKTYGAPIISSHYVAHSEPIVSALPLASAPIFTKTYEHAPIFVKSYAGPIISSLGHELNYW